MLHTHTHTHTHTLTTCNTHCFSTTTIVAGTRLNLTLYIHFLSSLSCEGRSSYLIECWDVSVMRKDGLKLGCSCLSVGGKVFSVRSRISLPCSHERVCGSCLERDKSRRHSNLPTSRFIKIPFHIISCLRLGIAKLVCVFKNIVIGFVYITDLSCTYYLPQSFLRG
jgi:hypothetical protein